MSMPTDARLIARHTYLLLIAMACTLMGALGFVTGFFLLADDALSMVITPLGALGVMLAGLGLGCAIGGAPRGRQFSALALLAVVGVAMIPAVSMGAVVLAPPAPMRLALLLVSLCLLTPPCHRHGRWLWRLIGGLGMIVGGGVLLVGQWLFDLSTLMGPHPASSSIGSLFMLVFGLALLLACAPRPAGGPSRPAGVVAALGIGVTCLLWYLMSFQHHLDIRRASGTMMDNAENAMIDVMNVHVKLLQRLAERIALSPDAEQQYQHLQDARAYLRDVPSISEITLLQPGQAPLWRQLRPGSGEPLALEHPALASWLERAVTRPRMVVLDTLYPMQAPALVAISVPAIQRRYAGLQLLARVDLAMLMRQEIRMDLFPFLLRVNLDGRTLLELSDGEHPARRPLFMNRRHSILPYGPEIELESYLGDMSSLGRSAQLRLLMALSGFFLSFLAAISIELMRLGLAKSRALELARDHLQNQHQIEAMVIRQQPLDDILAVIGRLLGGQLPACRSLLLRRHQDRLEPIGELWLPARLQQQLLAAAAGPLCRGRTLVFGEEHEDSLPGLLALLRAAGFSGALACPVRAADGRVLGGLLLCHPAALPPKAPDFIDNAVNLMALAMEREDDRAQLRDSEQRYRSLFDNHPDLVFALDPRGDVTSVNRAFCEQLALAPEAVLGRPWQRLVDAADRPATAQMLASVLAGRSHRYQLTADNGQGRRPVLDLTALPMVVNGRITGVYGIGKDITRQQQDQQRLAYNASHDALTGLPNRNLLEQRLRELTGYRDQLVLMFIDLDGFKPINDSLGHEVGDLMLVEVARRLRGLEGEGLLVRFGGDEFVLLLRGTSLVASAEALAGRLLTTLAQPYRVAHNELFITASIGLALSEGGEPAAAVLIQQADMAMYEAKRQGRNHFQWYNETLNTLMKRRLVLRNELQDAIDHHQLALHYQPLFNRDGKVVAVEALLRWPHPRQGFVSPADFIPLAEETGQIIAISEWVLERACRDAVRLNRDGRYRVAVNLSPLQFYRSGFLAALTGVLARHRLPAGSLELELTEGILMNDTQYAIGLLQEIRRLGIGVAIDDFGTGFSSLSYLKHLPADKVKIDRSFITDLATSPRDAAITRGILVMAHELALEVVAEGIETQDQLDWLRRGQCDYYQGFLLARPMPLEALLEFLAQNRERLLTAINK